MSVDQSLEQLGRFTVAVIVSPVTIPIWIARWVWALRSREAPPAEQPPEEPQTRKQLAEAAKQNVEESLEILDSLPIDAMEKEALRGHVRRQMIQQLRELM